MSSVLLTGATRGLGLEVASQLLQQPASVISQVYLTGRSPEAPEGVQKVISASKGRGHYVVLDITTDASVKEAAQKVENLSQGKGLDMLINNAAFSINEHKPTNIKPEDMDSILSVNVSSVQRVTLAFLPLLEKGTKKKIMNITSTLGSIALIKNFEQSPAISYKVSKAALNMLTSLWAQELKPKGFTVFVISPGWLKTELGGSYADLEVSQGAEQVVKILLEATPEKDNGAFRDIFVEGHPTYTGANPPW